MSAGQLVDYIDQGISRAIESRGLDKKVIPPEEILHSKAYELFKLELESRLDEFIREQLKLDDLKAELLEAFSGEFGKQVFDVTGYLVENEIQTWGDSIQYIVDEKLDCINEDVEANIKELVMTGLCRLAGQYDE